MNKIINKKKKAFTLIELIIVLAIMAIIAAIAIPNFMAVRDNSRNKADIQSCETIKRTTLMLVSDGTVTTALETFEASVSSGTVTVADVSATKTTATAADALTLATALKDIKAPQGMVLTNSAGVYTPGATKAVKYHIAIDASGNVTMTTL